MDSKKKQEFTRRLTCCNRGGMIIITYDILFSYLEDARAAKEAGDYEEFKINVRSAQQVVRRLMDTLDFHYPVSGELYELYRYVNKLLEFAVVKNTSENIQQAEKILSNLYDGFKEAAQQDDSEPLMKHTQQVVAGMTYDKGTLTETLQNFESTRGFFA